MASVSDTPTEREFGRYTLIRRIGRGGAGEVWEAELRGPVGSGVGSR